LERISSKNLLFLTAIRITDPEEKGIYTDLIRKFRDEGHQVFVVCPEERKHTGKTRLETVNGINILYVKSLNLQKTGLIEKGLATLSLSWLLFKAVKKYLVQFKFDLVLYSTPPITYNAVINFIKDRDRAVSYLLLKDIFPQNAVDLGMIKEDSFLHRYFKRIERKLYELSDVIGCMSEANRTYLLHHHPYLSTEKVEINPNSIDLKWLDDPKEFAKNFIESRNIPEDALICIYGGNLGKPQGVDFLLEILNQYKNDLRIFFFIIGDGTEFIKLNLWFEKYRPVNARLLKRLPKKDFDEIASHGDAGLILLDPRFTIPNFPSRLLSYLENKMSVWAATDIHTDIGEIVRQNEFGFWVKNGDLDSFIHEVDQELKNKQLNPKRGEIGYNYMKQNFGINRSYEKIMFHIK
jgi:glycosyltransferase involved in cell wall biosynthesis